MAKDKRSGRGGSRGGSDNQALELDEVSFQTEGPAVCPQTRKVSSGSVVEGGTSRTEGTAGTPRRGGTSRKVSSGSAVAVKAVVRWASYTCSRWKHSARQRIRRKLTGELLTLKYKGLAEDEGQEEEEEGDDVPDGVAIRHLNKKLLDHFRQLAASNQDSDQVDLQYLDTLLSDGADPNTTDRYGQTVLHEISRAWNVDVMWFFLERGADLHRPDGFGVTALHVAAALDYQEMIHFLLDHKAEVECRTARVQQTPLHFAAKNDAVEAVRLLVQAGADINARDYKSRTPLQLAANLDRSEAARTLLDLGADAGVKDVDGQLCITALIERMTPVAHQALKQFHVQDRMTRQQYYHLHLLEPPQTDAAEPQEKVVSEPTTPLECIVQQGRLELIMHPVVLKLIDIKWKLYGRLGAWLFLILNFLFIVSWTALGIAVSARRHTPDDLTLDWWCVGLLCAAVVLTVEEVFREISDVCRSRSKRKLWKDWSSRRLNDDLANAHPMWPEERLFLEDQMKEVKKRKGNYIQDLWNVFDWLVYALLAAVFGIMVAAMFVPSSALHTASLRVFAVVIIFLWVRLMKHVRAFRVMGPFIVMLGNVIGDVMRFLFLYMEIFIPYACAFWIIFGGQPSIPSMQTVWALLYSLYRLTLVDEYDFDAMVAVDPLMAELLCGSFLFLSSILCVNLLIALLSDTFQRVYDNAQANAVMQQASVILQVEEALPCLRRYYDDQHIHRRCAPLAEFYDHHVLSTSSTHFSSQIKDILDEFLQIQRDSSKMDHSCKDDTHTDACGSNVQFWSRATREGWSAVQEEEEEEEGAPGVMKALESVRAEQQKQCQELSALRTQLGEIHNMMNTLLRNTTHTDD